MKVTRELQIINRIEIQFHFNTTIKIEFHFIFKTGIEEKYSNTIKIVFCPNKHRYVEGWVRSG